MKCKRCEDYRWVNSDDMKGPWIAMITNPPPSPCPPGAPCPDCNPCDRDNPPDMGPAFTTLISPDYCYTNEVKH